MCVLTPEGIDQFKNLPEMGTTEKSSDPIQMKHAIIKTHSTAMLAGTAQQSKYRSFQEYMSCKQGDNDKIHKYGTEFSTRWNLAITMMNVIAEEDAAMIYFMGLNKKYKDLKI